MYGIGEVEVRRFRSYESFLYQVINLDRPESEIEPLRVHLKESAMTAAVEAERERVAREKMEGFGFTTPPGKGFDREKAFREMIAARQHRLRVIESKFNRTLVGDITKLEGEELTDFIAQCNFSEDFLYETDLVTILEAVNRNMAAYQAERDSTHSTNRPKQQGK
ncbi:MAG: hypothetical protein R2751_13875 [Bacteroidales bacterium]